ncbi:ASCE ATPase [Rhodococcus phage Apiary]|nr:ASCE ATPase [Rhodococcus phage Polyyuki]WNM69872.1 ASCE ATPase [Rhodococcus phage Apiary]
MSTALPDFIVGLEDYTESINMAVYADPGLGKTVLAGSARTLILATEHGTIAAARQGSKAKMASAMTVENLDRAYDFLAENCENEDFPFDWIAIDTATEMQNMFKRHIVTNRVDEGVAKNLNPYKVDLNEYGETQEMFKAYVKKFNDLPINTLWTAHAKTVEDEEGNTFICPDIHGKGYQLATWFGAQMHCLGYMRMDRVNLKDPKTGSVRETERRRIHWKAGANFRAKDRFDCLGAVTSGKSLDQLTKMIYDSAAVPEEPPAPKKAPAKKAAAPAKAPAPATA